MSDKRLVSSGELSAFMDSYRLKDSHGNALFEAMITYEIEGREEFTIESNVMINRGGYDNYGILRVMSDQPHDVPVEFSAKYQDFRFIKHSGLVISGTHKNKAIGKYQVLVVPDRHL